MLFQTVSMAHVDETRGVLDLGYENAVYVRPVYAQDTLKQTFTIKHLRNTSDKHHTIVTVGCELMNQKNQLVFACDKIMLYPMVTAPHKISIAPSTPPKPIASHLLAHVKYNIDNLPNNHSLAFLHPGQLVLHSVSRPIGNHANMSLSTMFHWTHPSIYNLKRYRDEEIVVPGGLVLAATISASSRGLFETLNERLEACSFISKVSPIDLIGAVTYIKEIKQVQEGLEEIHCTTLGFKNIDGKTQSAIHLILRFAVVLLSDFCLILFVSCFSVAVELKNLKLPVELFTERMRPHILGEFVKKHCPTLTQHIVVAAHRVVTRQSPFAQQRQIPLL